MNWLGIRMAQSHASTAIKFDKGKHTRGDPFAAYSEETEMYHRFTFEHRIACNRAQPTPNPGENNLSR